MGTTTGEAQRSGIERLVDDFLKGERMLDRRSTPGIKLEMQDLDGTIPRLVQAAYAAEALSPGCVVATGGDGRIDTPKLYSHLSGLLARQGLHVAQYGYNKTTPGIELGSERSSCAATFVVTASHLPASQNGLKVTMLPARPQRSGEQATGRIMNRESEWDASYQSHLRRIGSNLRGMRLAIDALHGTTGSSFSSASHACGASIEAELHMTPNGFFPDLANHAPDPSDYANLELLRSATIKTRADMGLAFDGDGDRLVAIESGGRIIEPTMLGLVFALDAAQSGLCSPRAAYVMEKKLVFAKERVMAMGLEPVYVETGRPHLRSAIIATHACGGYELSGHIFNSHAQDDAIGNALRLARICRERDMTVAQLVDEAAQGLPFYAPELRFSYDRAEAMAAICRLPQATGKDVLVGDSQASAYLRTSAHEDKVTAILFGESRIAVEEGLKAISRALPAELSRRMGARYEDLMAQRESACYIPKPLR